MVQLSIWDVILRLLFATLCGGVIGIERGKKHRAAGFRTYIVVSVGAAMTMILSQYITVMLTQVWVDSIPESFVSTDVSRFGAQVINGIGFLGAGTIIVTGRQQVKGMTTAAGLWASACMGLCIGAGFYAASAICCVLIILTVVVFSGLERQILARSRNINIFVEFENVEDLSSVLERIRREGVRIFDVELTKAKNAENYYPNAIFSLRLPKGQSHTELMTALSELTSVRSIEEL